MVKAFDLHCDGRPECKTHRFKILFKISCDLNLRHTKKTNLNPSAISAEIDTGIIWGVRSPFLDPDRDLT